VSRCSKKDLLDYLVGACEHHRRHVEAQSLRGFEINHEFVFRWRLHRQVGRLLALEDAIDITRGAPELIDLIGSIADQSAACDIVPVRVDRGQTVLGHKRDNQIAMNDRKSSRRDDEAAIRGTRECCNPAFDRAGVTRVNGNYLTPNDGATP
jgi:hypothetical protein